MKEDGRKMSKEQQKAARQRAMKLVDAGWVQADVAQAVRQWGQHRREHGIKSLLADARGRGAGDGRTLQKEQEKEMQKLIRDKLPDQLKLPFALWTRKAVAQLTLVALRPAAAGAHDGRVFEALGFHSAKAHQESL